MKIPSFIGGTDEQRSTNLADNKLVNLYPTLNNDGSIAAFYKVDGLKSEGTLAGVPTGAYKASNGRAFYTSGTVLYELTVPAGVYTSTSRGTITTATNYEFSDNGLEMIMVNGTDGWIFTFATNTLVKLTIVTGDITITVASPAVCTKTNHGLAIGDAIQLSTTGVLPSPLLPYTIYYVISAGFTSNTFQLSLTAGGTAINTVLTGVKDCVISTNTGTGGNCTISNASPAVVTKAGHGFTAGDVILFDTSKVSSTGVPVVLPNGLLPNTLYYVLSPATDTFTVSLTKGGAAVNTTSAGSGQQVVISLSQGTVYDINGVTLAVGDEIKFSTTGALPTGVTAGTSYYLTSTHNFTLTQYYYNPPLLNYYVLNSNSQTLTYGSKIRVLCDGVYPAGIIPDKDYYIVNIYNDFLGYTGYKGISETAGGFPIAYGNIGTGSLIAVEQNTFGFTTTLAGIYGSRVATTGTQSGTQSYYTSDILPYGTHSFETIGSGFPNGCKTISYMNGRFIACEPNTQNFYVSEVLNGKNWATINVQTVDSNPDYVTGQIVAHNELFVFCENSGETYYDSGTTPTPFVRNLTGIFEVGCKAPYTIKEIGGAVIFLGNTNTGNGIVYRMSGLTPVRISTYSIEYQIQQMTDISDARAFTYQKDGHHYYVLTFPTGNKTFVFDVSTSLWHERDNFGLNIAALTPATIACGANSNNMCISEDGLSLYSISANANTVNQYSRNSTTGLLTLVTSIATGSFPYGIDISQDGTSVYVANYSSANVYNYSRNTTTGALTYVSSVSSGSGPNSVVCSKDNLNVYVTNFDSSTVTQYSRNITTGVLTLIGTITGITNPNWITISDDGVSVYVPTYGTNVIYNLSRNLTTGVLTNVNNIATGSRPYGVVVSSSGAFIYVANAVSSDIYAYSRNITTGTLTNIGTISTGASPYGITVSSDGLYLYASCSGTSKVYEYLISTNGTLNYVGQVSTGAGVKIIILTPDKNNLYSLNSTDSTIGQYSTISSYGYKWQANKYLYFNNEHLVTDDTTTLYSIDSSTYKNGFSPIRIVRSFRAPPSDMKRVAHHTIQVDCEVGIGTGTEPVIALRWSDDAGNTWSTPIERGLGVVGEYSKSVIFRRLGSTKGIPRIYELSCDENVKITLLDCYLE